MKTSHPPLSERSANKASDDGACSREHVAVSIHMGATRKGISTRESRRSFAPTSVRTRISSRQIPGGSKESSHLHGHWHAPCALAGLPDEKSKHFESRPKPKALPRPPLTCARGLEADMSESPEVATAVKWWSAATATSTRTWRTYFSRPVLLPPLMGGVETCLTPASKQLLWADAMRLSAWFTS